MSGVKLIAETNRENGREQFFESAQAEVLLLPEEVEKCALSAKRVRTSNLFAFFSLVHLAKDGFTSERSKHSYIFVTAEKALA